MKKILVSLIFFFLSIAGVSAVTFKDDPFAVPGGSVSTPAPDSNGLMPSNNIQTTSQIINEETSKANTSKSCATSTDPNNFCSPEFKIEVNEFTPVEHTFVGYDQTLSDFFTYVINDLMVGLGVIALLIMTVGAGYMIFYHGQDEYLSKGKSIFMAGITALIVALSSYYLVSLLRYILYS